MSALPSIEMAVVAACDAIVKLCRCGAAYDAESWASLPLCGYIGAYEGESGEQRVVEMRHCSCLSTIAIDIEVPVRLAS